MRKEKRFVLQISPGKFRGKTGYVTDLNDAWLWRHFREAREDLSGCGECIREVVMSKTITLKE